MGKANDPRERLKQHLAYKDVSHRAYWIQSLQRQGKIPGIAVLLEVSMDAWQYWERAFIQRFQDSGVRLVNGTDGGEAPMEGRTHRQETRIKMSQAHKGIPMSRRTRKRMSAGQRLRWSTPVPCAGPGSKNVSGFLGVSWKSERQKWTASIKVAGHAFHLGYFSSAEEAARVRDAATKKYYPPSSYLNFPNTV